MERRRIDDKPVHTAADTAYQTDWTRDVLKATPHVRASRCSAGDIDPSRREASKFQGGVKFVSPQFGEREVIFEDIFREGVFDEPGYVQAPRREGLFGLLRRAGCR